MDLKQRIRGKIEFLYSEAQVEDLYPRLMKRIEIFQDRHPQLKNRKAQLSQADVLCITYGDQVNELGKPPLQSFVEFADKHLKGVVSGIHILPFFPFSSDDGFSVIDYYQVNPALGTWEDVRKLESGFRLMFDAVINHVSAESTWFKEFLRDQPPYSDYFISVDPGGDLSMVVRPRALPLLTKVATPCGEKHVWTTFSDDQFDLNFANPEVLLEIIDILLYYVEQGAELIRLDAIAYLWKEIGTTCIHLPQTHCVVQLFRDVLDAVAPHAMLITETNVPHTENVSYFGDGKNEAQLVYNFALPPLTLHTLQTADATAISRWAKSLNLPSNQVTFFNFLASHDGIGVNPARGILTEEEIAAIITKTQSHGGLVSYKHNQDGTQSPYELNINFFDALSNPNSGEQVQIQIDRFITAHAIMLSIIGLPGIYFHSLFGSRGWLEGVVLTGRNRTINRQKLQRSVVEQELDDPDGLRQKVFTRLAHLIRLRAEQPAFHPFGKQQVVELAPAIFGVLRVSPDGANHVLCLHNVTMEEVPIELDLGAYGSKLALDLNDPGRSFRKNHKLNLKPYQVLWLALEL